MKISLSWLRSCVDLGSTDLDTISNTLTDLGLEVEGITHSSKVQGDLLLGKILRAEPHPNADTLQVCSVDVGQAEPLQIVCGAANARAGLKVCVATVGCVLPGDFKIKKSKIRGVESCGMLCAASEIELPGDNGGIMELDTPLKLGADLKGFFALEDTCLEINVTPNRPDCLSHYGIARDLAAKLSLNLTPWNADLLKPTGDKTINVQINGEFCARFVALQINGIDAKATSPSWMSQRLETCGLRSINLIVDCANYVMLHTGQPIHTYDAANIQDSLICRNAIDGERLRTLDEKEHVLTSEDIVIADTVRALGLAGVMGGADSAIGEDTQAMILEVASFDAGRIRRTSKRLGYHTDASHRFERGVDIHQLRDVAMFFVHLLSQCHKELGLSPISYDGQCQDLYPQKKDPAMIAVRLESVRRVLSDPSIEMSEVCDHLENLGLVGVDQTPDKMRMLFQIPHHRLDLVSEIDVIEEVARLRGLDRVAERSLKPSGWMQAKDQCLLTLHQAARSWMAAQGFSETITFPFVSQADLERFKIATALALKNPIADHLSHMRPTMAISLSQAVKANQDRFHPGVKLFEIGRVYGDQHVFADNPVVFHKRTLRQKEINVLGWIADDSQAPKHWMSQGKTSHFMYYKGLAESFLLSLGLNPEDVSFRPLRPALSFAHPREGLEIWHKDAFLGYLGLLHPSLGFKDVFVAEFCLDSIYECYSLPTYRSDTDVYPSVDRDLSFVLAKSTHYEKVRECLDAQRFRFLKSYQVFDVFHSERLGADKKSLAMNFVFQSPKKTLSDQDIEHDLGLIRSKLTEVVGAEFR